MLEAYFQILFIVAFYTPVRRYLEGYYLPIVMERFPILYFFNALITIFVMYLYHKSALFEIDYANRLNEEVDKQTEVAREQSRIATEQSKIATEQSRIATERANQLEILSVEMVETLAGQSTQRTDIPTATRSVCQSIQSLWRGSLAGVRQKCRNLNGKHSFTTLERSAFRMQF